MVAKKRNVKDDVLTKSEIEKLRFCFNHSAINDIIKANKLLRKAKRERIFLKFDSQLFSLMKPL